MLSVSKDSQVASSGGRFSNRTRTWVTKQESKNIFLWSKIALGTRICCDLLVIEVICPVMKMVLLFIVLKAKDGTLGVS